MTSRLLDELEARDDHQFRVVFDAVHELIMPLSVVLLATRSGEREILTADRRDFAVYRVSGRVHFIDVLAGE